MKGDLRNLSNKNIQFVFAPINIGTSTNGIIDKDFSDFYVERSGNNIDLTYIGNVAIGKQYVTNSNTPLFIENNFCEWRKLVSRIHENNSQIGVQLGCRYYPIPALRKNNEQKKLSYVEEMSTFIQELDKREIETIISHFISNALVASKLHFDWVQIHAAHGYFLSLLLSPQINRRKDEYNINDLFFLQKIIDGIRKTDTSIKIDIRVSFLEGLNEIENELFEKKIQFDKLANIGFDMISLSNGMYDYDKKMIYPVEKKGFLPMYELAIDFVNKYQNINWNFSGNVNDIPKIKKINLLKNLSFSIGRPLIADPKFLKHINNSNNDLPGSSCNYCGACHYYSNNKTTMICPQYTKKYGTKLI